jgi:caspase domain-containing protein
MTPRPRYHVLLVGIDDYGAQPLAGCVNDIDAVQRLLLDRIGLASDSIRRLASPRTGNAGHAGAVAEQPATLANLRHALAELGTRRVEPGDRVFIYYAGHGARVAVRAGAGRTYHREALVLADHDPARPDSGMLYDFELNQALRAIAYQTRSVTLVLDCCHAAGVMRSAGELRPPEDLASREPIARYIDLERMAPVPDPGPPPPGDLEVPRPLFAAGEHCHVVAACLGHERANEECGRGGVRHGRLTSALLEALDPIPDAALTELRWSEIWHGVYATVSQRNPAQHPRMAGKAARAVFAGPPVQHDPGIPVSQAGPSSGPPFRIAAGTLANITTGAVLAVYGDQPLQFPPMGSAEDQRARIGLVQVTAADLATATGVPQGLPFELPPGARGRLIAAGEAARLRCAVIPRNAQLEAQLRASPLLHVVSPGEGRDVALEFSRQRWFVTDNLYSHGPDRPVLCSLLPHELGHARAAIEHYRAYSLPLRMAERLTDLPGTLSLRVRIAPESRALPDNVAHGANSPQLAATSADSYMLRAGARVFFEVRNHSPHRLRVTLVNAAASGRVQFLGDHMIDAGALHVFWVPGAVGLPFTMVLPHGIDRGLDRLVAIGRTAHAHDLDYLRVDGTFVDAVTPRRGRPVGGDGLPPAPAPPPLEQWTVAQAIIETHR